MDANRFTQKSLEALQSASQLAQSFGNAQVEQLHLLSALLSQENGLIGAVLCQRYPGVVWDKGTAPVGPGPLEQIHRQRRQEKQQKAPPFFPFSGTV